MSSLGESGGASCKIVGAMLGTAQGAGVVYKDACVAITTSEAVLFLV